jgi:hypothetical protein
MMMISLMEGIGTILVVFSNERIPLPALIPIPLTSRSMADVITVKPHIPGDKIELP